MSRRQLSRTPANFPRMKDRAAGRAIRRQRKLEAQQVRAILDLAPKIAAAIAAAVDAIADTLNRAADAFMRITEALAAGNNSGEEQANYALAGPAESGPE